MMRKAGVVTGALALIALGVVVLLHVTVGTPYAVLKYAWPLLLIGFGVEVTWGAFRGGGVRFSGWSIGFLALVVLCSLGFYVVPSLTAVGYGYEVPVKGQLAVGSEIRAVDINLANTAVTITGTSSRNLSYTGLLMAEASSQSQAASALRTEWSVHRSGHTLVLDLIYPPGGVSVAADWQQRPFGPGPYLDVVMPESLLSNVSTSNAAVHIQHLSGASEVHTSNGAVSLTAIGSSAFVRTSNGAVSLNDISGAVDAATSNAAVSVDSQVGGGWAITTSNGPIHLSLQGAPEAHISATTTNAVVDGNIRWTYAGSGKRHGRATLSTGAHPVVVMTTNDPITVNAGG